MLQHPESEGISHDNRVLATTSGYPLAIATVRVVSGWLVGHCEPPRDHCFLLLRGKRYKISRPRDSTMVLFEQDPGAKREGGPIESEARSNKWKKSQRSEQTEKGPVGENNEKKSRNA